MFCKREDGLGALFVPFYIAAILPTALCAHAAGLTGLALLGAVIGLFIAWSVGLLFVYIIFVWFVSLTVDLNKPVTEDRPFYRFIVLSIIGLLCRMGRVRIHVRGIGNIPEGRFLLVGNHRSNYDPIVTVWALRRWKMGFITKPENLKIPIVRTIHAANYLAIDRKDPRKAVATIRAAADLLKRDVVNIGVYPEGTRSKGKEMLPFHNAVFKIAQQGRVPILVAAISGTENIHVNLPWRHTDVTLSLRAVIDAGEVAASSTRDLGDRVRAILEREAEALEVGIPDCNKM